MKERNDIVEVASQYLTLDRRGYSYWACCPFHHEKTPSFSIHSIDQYYHCFGCGTSGGVIQFVMGMENVTFYEAVKLLADRAGMPMPENNYDGERAAELKQKKDRLLQIMLQTARFYLKNLYGGKADEHLEYIAKRELSPTTVKKFGLGASLDYRSLPAFLQDAGFTREEIAESGACSLTDDGKLIDAQANRLIIPIINAMDEVIAFGGRILGQKSDRVAKYKNTKDTLLFNKRKNLYNLNLLKRYKRNNPLPYVIMVEGYMDTISLYQAGFCNVVASMGTSLTSEQARMLKRYSENVMISYDQDGAGQNADLRGLEILRAENLNVKVVLMPEGEDPDDVCRKHGAAAYQKCLDDALPLTDYQLHALGERFDLTRAEGRRAYEQAAIPIIRRAASAAEREDLLKNVRDKTGFTLQSLQQDLERYVPPQETMPPSPERTKAEREKSDAVKKACRFIVGAALFDQPYAAGYPLREEDFTDDVHRLTARYILDCRAKGRKLRVSDLFEAFGEEEEELNAIIDLNTEERLLGAGAERYYNDCVRTIEKQRLQGKIAALQEKIGAETDIARRREWIAELSDYTKELKKYNERNGGNTQ